MQEDAETRRSPQKTADWRLSPCQSRRNDNKNKIFKKGCFEGLGFRLLFRGFSVAFPWLFRGPLLSRKTVFGCFSCLFRGPRSGQNLRVLALEQSSDLKIKALEKNP